jgi:putative phage-type endonuclease
MLTPEQIEIRSHGVTGSEIAAVAGLSPYAGPQDVWARKLGLDPGPEQNAAMERGNYLENALVSWTADREGVIVERIGEDQQTIVCPDNDLVIATPDGIAYLPTDTKTPIAIVEVKSPGWRTAKDWSDPTEVPDGIPIYYLPQVTWEMAAAQLDQSIVGALVDGELLTYRIDFNADLFAKLLERAKEFWDFVRTRTPPPVSDNDPDPGRWIRAYYSTQEDEDMLEPAGDLGTELRSAVMAYEDARQVASDAEKAKKAAAAVLQTAIGGHAGIQGDGYKVTWKQTRDKTVTDYKEIVEAVGVSEETIAKHTRTKPGYRTMRVTVKKGS